MSLYILVPILVFCGLLFQISAKEMPAARSDELRLAAKLCDLEGRATQAEIDDTEEEYYCAQCRKRWILFKMVSAIAIIAVGFLKAFA